MGWLATLKRSGTLKPTFHMILGYLNRISRTHGGLDSLTTPFGGAGSIPEFRRRSTTNCPLSCGKDQGLVLECRRSQDPCQEVTGQLPTSAWTLQHCKVMYCYSTRRTWSRHNYHHQHSRRSLRISSIRAAY